MSLTKNVLEPRPSKEDNPLLVELTRKLKEEFRVKPNSRCIIFVKTRAIARALLTYLTENLSSLSPKQLTGAAARMDSFGKYNNFHETSLLLLCLVMYYVVGSLSGYRLSWSVVISHKMYGKF